MLMGTFRYSLLITLFCASCSKSQMGEGEKTQMKRRREQRGTVYAKSGMWYLRYTDFRVTDGQLHLCTTEMPAKFHEAFLVDLFTLVE